MSAAIDALVAFEPTVVDRVEESVDRAEVLRYLGYAAGAVPNQYVASLLDPWIDKANQLATPRAVYVVLPVTAKDRRTLRLQTANGSAQFKGAIGEFLEPAQLVAAFIATAGSGVEEQASQLLRQGEALPAMIVNAVGSERAEAAEAAVIARLRRKAAPLGFAPTLPYSPGYCGMKLVEQMQLFSLFDGVSVGVTLTGDCLMRPLKSVSGLIGLGPADHVAAAGSPCDRCELYTCAMRR